MDHPGDLGSLFVKQGLLLDERGHHDHLVGAKGVGRRPAFEVENLDHLEELSVHTGYQAQLVGDRGFVQLVGLGEQEALG